jgi:dipeptidyl aminopeptidase/acylaminoacyl peptidase
MLLSPLGGDALVRRGLVDPGRIGLYGMSNGGGVADYLVTRTDRFKCAVAVSPAVSDFVRPSLLHTLDPMYQSFAGGKSVWEDPEGYVKLSSVFHLNRVHTPMLLADGDEAGEFLLNSIEVYNGPRWFGQDVTLLRYPKPGHGFTGAALKDFWQRRKRFFEGCLRPER